MFSFESNTIKKPNYLKFRANVKFIFCKKIDKKLLKSKPQTILVRFSIFSEVHSPLLCKFYDFFIYEKYGKYIPRENIILTNGGNSWYETQPLDLSSVLYMCT